MSTEVETFILGVFVGMYLLGFFNALAEFAAS